MNGYWITFTDNSAGYCEGENEYDAAKIAEKFSGKTVGGGPWKDFTMKRLPYPANPIIWQYEHPIHGKCPAFCHAPRTCAGSTACPRNLNAVLAHGRDSAPETPAVTRDTPVVREIFERHSRCSKVLWGPAALPGMMLGPEDADAAHRDRGTLLSLISGPPLHPKTGCSE